MLLQCNLASSGLQDVVCNILKMVISGLQECGVKGGTNSSLFLNHTEQNTPCVRFKVMGTGTFNMTWSLVVTNWLSLIGLRSILVQVYRDGSPFRLQINLTGITCIPLFSKPVCNILWWSLRDAGVLCNWWYKCQIILKLCSVKTCCDMPRLLLFYEKNRHF